MRTKSPSLQGKREEQQSKALSWNPFLEREVRTEIDKHPTSDE
jgi:hypothetical protein